MSFLHTLRRQTFVPFVLIFGTLAVGILIGTLLDSHSSSAQAQAVRPPEDAALLQVPPLEHIGSEFTALANQVEPSVVHIAVELRAPEPPAGVSSDGGSSGDLPDFLDRLFPKGIPEGMIPPGGLPQMPRRGGAAAGTGFIVDPSGYIVTNRHVVEEAAKITVRTHSGKNEEYRARVVGTDNETDLAVLKIDAGKPLPAVKIGNSDAVQVGDWAVAIGSPFGLEATVTAGIVSALDRGRDEVGDAQQFQDFIQTDAAINPGNSGGPLLNIRGEVIGVNTAIATRSGASAGVGFALPSNMVVRVYNDLVRYGQVRRGSIGVTLAGTVQNHDDITLKAMGLDHGAIVELVAEGGPADQAGLKARDIILAVNGEDVADTERLIAQVADLPLDEPARLTIDRGGEMLDIDVTIADRMVIYKDKEEIVGRRIETLEDEPREAAAGTVKFGIQLRSNLTPQEVEMLGGRKGVVVSDIVEDSFAEEVGLQPNDVIDTINRTPVGTIDDIRQLQEGLLPGDAVAFHVVRMTPQGAAGQFLSGILPAK